jgi:hypothetical protein
MSCQGGQGLRAPGAAPVGGAVPVQVGTGDKAVESNTGSPTTRQHPVRADGRATVPLPPVPPGTIVAITVGRGLQQRVILVEVVAPGP